MSNNTDFGSSEQVQRNTIEDSINDNRPRSEVIGSCFLKVSEQHNDLYEQKSWIVAREGLYVLIDRALQSKILAPELLNDFESLAFIYFCLARDMSPLYVSFANKLQGLFDDRILKIGRSHSRQIVHPKIIFEGRDSLPFLVAYNALYGTGKQKNWVYAPSSRITLQNTLRNTKNQKSEDETNHVAQFYKQHDLFNHPLIFADFGAHGTLPRVQRLMLEKSGYKFRYGMDVLVAIKDTYKSASKCFEEEGIFSPIRNARRDMRDKTLVKSVYGLLNNLDPQGAGKITEDNVNKIISLQEMGSYIKELRPNGFGSIKGQTPLESSSIAELSAKWGYLRGLCTANFEDFNIRDKKGIKAIDNAAVNSILTFYRVSKQHPLVYNFISDNGYLPPRSTNKS